MRWQLRSRSLESVWIGRESRRIAVRDTLYVYQAAVNCNYERALALSHV